MVVIINTVLVVVLTIQKIHHELTSLSKSVDMRQSYPNSTRIPNCTPVMGIGAPTLYVNLSHITNKSHIR